MNDFFELFVALIRKLLTGAVDPAAFKAEYMRLWRACRDAGKLEVLNASANQAFDRIFTASDSFCEDPALRDSRDLDERQFVEEVTAISRDVRRREC
jgi:hypothetical protein